MQHLSLDIFHMRTFASMFRYFVIPSWAIFLGLYLVSCDEDPEPLKCDCTNKSHEAIHDNVIVVSTIEGYRLLSPTKGYYTSCNDIDESRQTDGLMVTIDGDRRAECINPLDIYKFQMMSYLEITDIAIATDSTFKNPNFKISIIRSEDYGYSPGFGYSIDHTGDIDILQATIPAIGGNKPFRSETDAFKTAVLVTYLLNLNIGLPSVTIADLEYLKVI